MSEVRQSIEFVQAVKDNVAKVVIGQEVVVDFLEGDPDRPLIVGSVYNGEQMPPYDPKTDASKIYLKSNSTKGGEGFNELFFERQT